MAARTSGFLYDPDATPAVVNVNVSSGATMTSPPAFQGIIVPATGLVVLDLHRWVFEASRLRSPPRR